MSETASRDDEALELRASGETFMAIARKLGFDRIQQAREAFDRALRRKDPKERKSLRDLELTHLEAMAEGVRDEEKYGPDESARLLAKVDEMRTRLLAD
jgi:hypothetical protein